MHPKIKKRSSAEKPVANTPKPLLLHEVTNQLGSAKAASRKRAIAMQPASGTANHSRHHTLPHSQS